MLIISDYQTTRRQGEMRYEESGVNLSIFLRCFQVKVRDRKGTSEAVTSPYQAVPLPQQGGRLTRSGSIACGSGVAANYNN